MEVYWNPCFKFVCLTQIFFCLVWSDSSIATAVIGDMKEFDDASFKAFLYKNNIEVNWVEIEVRNKDICIAC